MSDRADELLLDTLRVQLELTEKERDQLRDALKSGYEWVESMSAEVDRVQGERDAALARLAKVEEAARRKLGCTSCDIDQSIRTGLCRKCAGDLGAALGGEVER